MTISGIESLLSVILLKSGLRTINHSRDRKEIARAHGFRKFFTTQVINSKVNPEIREMLLGHKIGLASCYYRPTQEDMLNEYSKAVDLLTIYGDNRLKKKIREIELQSESNSTGMRSELFSKQEEIMSLSKQNVTNSDAIAALSEQVIRLTEEIQLLKNTTKNAQ